MSLWRLGIAVLYFLRFSNGFEYYKRENFSSIIIPESFADGIQNFVANYEHTISTQCRSQLLQYGKALFIEPKLWAWQMFDAGSKLPPSGMLRGNLADLGDFDLCLIINQASQAKEKDSVFGKYCLASIPLFDANNQKLQSDVKNFETPETRTFTPDGKAAAVFATCLPDACSNTDIEKLYAALGIGIKIFDNMCQSVSTKPEITGGDIATITFFSIILCLMVVSTIYDVFLFYLEKEPCHSLLIAFSVLTNGKKLTAISKNPSQISCLHGIRVISMMWVMLAHRYSTEFLAKKNILDISAWTRDPKNMFIMGGTVSVDTFFLIGGLVVAYSFMGAMEKQFKFNIALFYIHRYLRLTPLLAVMVLINITVLEHLGSGPLWPSITTSFSQPCEENWWATLIYVQNYVDSLNQCVAQAWYLSVDTQLYLLSPILLIPLKKWPKIGLSLTGVFTLASVLASFLIAWFDKLYGFMILNILNNYHEHYYFPTHTRASVWLMGIALGYYIYKLKHNQQKFAINKLVALLLWVISLAILCTCVFTGHDEVKLGVDEEYDRVLNSFHVALLRPAWALGVSWVIFACVFGYGGPVNWFLSLPMFQVVSKLTYSMYLVHMLIQNLISGQTKTTAVFNDLDTMYKFWGDFAFTFAAALLLTLAFESPIIVIEKAIFGKSEKKESPLRQPAQDIKKIEIF